MSWSRRFDDPIRLPAGGELRTLREAADYIMVLPKQVSRLPHWQVAGHIVLAAAEGRDFLLHAQIAMGQALHHGQPSPPRPPDRAKKYRLIR